MTRRRKPPARAAIQWLGWSVHHAELFDLAAADWTPPDRVKVQRTIRGSTWTARFTTPRGERPCVVVRLRHGPIPVNDCEVVDRRVKFAWRMTGAQLRAAYHPEAEVQS